MKKGKPELTEATAKVNVEAVVIPQLNLDIPMPKELKTLVVKAIVLMIGTKIVAIFDGKTNGFFHTKEHDLEKQEIEVYQEHIIARYKIDPKKKFDENALKRADIYYYWRTTKRGRVYRPTPQYIGNVTSVVAV